MIATEANNALKANSSRLDGEHCKNKENMEALFKVISADLVSKRQPFTKNSKLMMKSLKEKLGEAELKEVAKEALGSEAEVSKIMKAFLVKKGKDSSKGFRDFLKKKQSVKQKKGEPSIFAPPAKE